MMTWGHMIWIFFPIPLFCLILLSMPLPQKFEKFGPKLVGKIFFTRVSVGLLYIRLVYVFIGASVLIFTMASRTIQVGFGSAHIPCSGWVALMQPLYYCGYFLYFCAFSSHVHKNKIIQESLSLSHGRNNVVPQGSKVPRRTKLLVESLHISALAPRVQYLFVEIANCSIAWGSEDNK